MIILILSALGIVGSSPTQGFIQCRLKGIRADIHIESICRIQVDQDFLRVYRMDLKRQVCK